MSDFVSARLLSLVLFGRILVTQSLFELDDMWICVSHIFQKGKMLLKSGSPSFSYASLLVDETSNGGIAYSHLEYFEDLGIPIPFGVLFYFNIIYYLFFESKDTNIIQTRQNNTKELVFDITDHQSSDTKLFY